MGKKKKKLLLHADSNFTSLNPTCDFQTQSFFHSNVINVMKKLVIPSEAYVTVDSLMNLTAVINMYA